VTDVSINLDDILVEMDELGRAKFDAALERAKNRKLTERIEELTAQRAEDKPAPAPRNNGSLSPSAVEALDREAAKLRG
jgi:BMFP domain-containing protein YqiC